MSSPSVVWVNFEAEESSLIPQYQSEGSAGCDLRSAENIVINPGDRATVSTGLKIEIPSGFEAQIRPRSGLAAKHGVTVLNSPGTIDSDYRGLIKVILLNTGDEPFIVSKGDRIAQMVFSEYSRCVFLKAEKLSSTQRGEGGFGSTGKL
jgi:dUTP pyrophosphatase